MADVASESRDGIPRDTTPDAWRVQGEALRAMGIEGRARMTFELSDNLRRSVEAGVRHRHPEYDEDQVRLAGIRLRLGDELFGEVYPDLEIQP